MKVGDKVEVIRYGHIYWQNKKVDTTIHKDNIYYEDEDFYFIDMIPELVGQKGVIVRELGGDFAVDGIKGKHAWYKESQLKLI